MKIDDISLNYWSCQTIHYSHSIYCGNKKGKQVNVEYIDKTSREAIIAWYDLLKKGRNEEIKENYQWKLWNNCINC